MGHSHALTGLAAGLALAPAVGLTHPGEIAVFAVAVAGYALLPDLDCGGATASRLLGPVTGVLSRALRWCSKRLYAATKGPRDEDWTGGHRHMTHTAVFAAALGVLAWWTSGMSPWAVAGWLAFGLLLAAATLGDWAAVVGAAAVGLPMLLGGGEAPLAALAHMQGWVGLAVALGCVVHDLGDAVTVSGVPILWPLPVAGETWYEIKLLPPGLRLHTGRRVERWVVAPLLVVTVAGLVWARGVHAWPAITHVNRTEMTAPIG